MITGRRVRTFVGMVFFALLVAGMITGCGSEGTDAGQSGVKVENGVEGGTGEKVQPEGKPGSPQVEVTEFEPSEESLGVAVYPGSELVPGSGLVSRATREDKVLVSNQAEFRTGDDYQKVVNWYRGGLGTPAMTDPQQTTWILREEEVIRSVMVERADRETRIKIIRLCGALDIGLQD